MEPALAVTLLWLVFAATHVGLATRRLRDPLAARLGDVGFTLAFSLVAVAALTPVVHYYAVHRFEGAGGLALGRVPLLRGVLIAVIVAGVVLAWVGLVAFPASPMAMFGQHTSSPRGVARITRHPFLVGLALATAAHALLATRLAGTAFFGELALFSAAGAWHQDRKLLRLRGGTYADYVAATSAVPFAALAGGRQRLPALGLAAVAATASGLAVALLLRHVHASIFADGGARVMIATVGGAALLSIQSWRVARRRERRGDRAASAPRLDAMVSRRQALATAGAALLAYVGVAHEVVGARLYPDGPALFGGPLGWHAAGLSLVGLGVAMMYGTLGLARVPIVPLALVGIVAGAVNVVGDAVVHGGFHFFASTMVVAGTAALVAARPRVA